MPGPGEVNLEESLWWESLVKLRKEARDELAQLGWGPDYEAPDQETYWRSWMCSWLVASIDDLLKAIKEGDVWDVARCARAVGLYEGLRRGPQYTSLTALKSLARWMRPDAERGRTVLAGATQAGRGRKGWRKVSVPDEELKAEVKALQDQGETLTNARRRVSDRHNIPLSTLRRRTTQ